MSNKKQKTIDLGQVMKPSGSPFFSFDKTIKKIEITREYEKDGETVTEVLQVAPNPKNKDYLAGAFINKYAENVNFKREQGWINDKQAEQQLAYGEKQKISSVFQVKVES